jgi:hypothetical protein
MSAFDPKRTFCAAFIGPRSNSILRLQSRKSWTEFNQGGDPMNVRLACLAAAMLTVTFSTVSFSQGTPEQRRACKNDAFRLCRDTIPDVPRITECMHKNQKKLSPACKAFFKPG